MKNQSLITQFRHTFIFIIIASIVATVITYVFALYLYIHSLNKDIYPPNYYERQVPRIEKYINEKNIALLSQSNEEGLKRTIRGDDMLYQVVDNNGNILYGTNPKKLFKTKEELFNNNINKTVRKGGYIHTVPIKGDNGKIEGAVILFYQVKITFANIRGRFVFAVIIMALFSPFLYIVGFTRWLSKRFVKNINQPLHLLIDASKKIKEKDLDFEIDYYSDNELGKLCSAFSEMKDELKGSLSAQWKMEQERVEMVEALAHDLKSPLSIILGYTDALIGNNTDDNEKLHRYLTVIRENTEKSAALVQKMQYTSDLEKSNIQLNLVPINLPEFLRQKVQDYELQAHQKEVELILKMQGNIQSPIQIDVDRLTRIFDNIISNSLQYTPSGGNISITVKDEKNCISYEICDSGRGFSSKDLKKALDKFYRGDEARQTKGGHSGLGLYIVKQLVEQLGGSVKIENSKSGGACVKFWHSI
ncbi:TPA: HAMP domain-containing histidine kinase [Clostridioides difficile]|uniref:Lantibiotic resistance two-component sensor kinase n=1 Tax=Clostridioides difficile ATCC 9689 = DSM 1296 TaxID=1121308 RepID=A0AC59FVZ7_CLODI|nr:HAMP domain-containing histidine kinase [Clostridioides difficile]AKP41549.1 lantibiotic resistance two-component sensor kinase [Clostridioides difficile ATCC 9689 = DSM 1296]ARC14801.1 sensor histidine kinase [Clostridioides difficile]AVI11156.1 sensor histidine kinase [Clostridioides difficile]AXU85421.1 lantibiotic resistance two-component sensor kinase [Clostridioides difficile]EGT3641537.1 HAMP domain-containing histidine kinase [Clostridioides difficile]